MVSLRSLDLGERMPLASQGCVYLGAQNKGWALLAEKTNLCTKQVMCLGRDCPPGPAQLGIYDRTAS